MGPSSYNPDPGFSLHDPGGLLITNPSIREDQRAHGLHGILPRLPRGHGPPIYAKSAASIGYQNDF